METTFHVSKILARILQVDFHTFPRWKAAWRFHDLGNVENTPFFSKAWKVQVRSNSCDHGAAVGRSSDVARVIYMFFLCVVSPVRPVSSDQLLPLRWAQRQALRRLACRGFHHSTLMGHGAARPCCAGPGPRRVSPIQSHWWQNHVDGAFSRTTWCRPKHDGGSQVAVRVQVPPSRCV